MYRYHDKPSDETEPSTAEQLKIAYVQNTERWVHQGRNMTGQSMSQYQEIGTENITCRAMFKTLRNRNIHHRRSKQKLIHPFLSIYIIPVLSIAKHDNPVERVLQVNMTRSDVYDQDIYHLQRD